MDRLEELFPNCEVKQENPTNPNTGNKLSQRLAIWMQESFSRSLQEHKLVCLAWPNIHMAGDALQVSLWLNSDDLAKGFSARRAMKPGKAIRHLFPTMTDSELEKAVDTLRARFGERKYTLKIGKECADFVHAYTHTQAPMENPYTSSMRKSLSNSCMRYDETLRHRDTNGVLRHPVEAYASGDFTIVWVETGNGHIAARCVYADSDHAPIYGVCEKSMDMIQEHLKSESVRDDGWTGKELLRIEGEHGGFIAPYLDLTPQSLSDNGGSLVVEYGGEIDASDYSGLLNEESCTCENCSARMSEDESFCVDEMTVCESCYEDSSFCERYEENTFQTTRLVYSWNDRRCESTEQYWCESAIDDNATYVDGEYWDSECLLADNEGNDVTLQQFHDGEFFYSDWDGNLYPSSVMCETNTEDRVAREELGDSWQVDANGIWHDIKLTLELESEAA